MSVKATTTTPHAFPELDLEQLGKQAHAHYKQGEKANTKANDHAMSCGKYLAEAKRRIDEQHPYGDRTTAWTQFLGDYCPLKPARSYQLIAIATGKTTEEAEAAKQREADHRRRDTARAAKQISMVHGKVQEAAPPANSERADLMAHIIDKLERLSIDQLHAVERIIPAQRRVVRHHPHRAAQWPTFTTTEMTITVNLNANSSATPDSYVPLLQNVRISGAAA